jgi:hypothetical protein
MPASDETPEQTVFGAMRCPDDPPCDDCLEQQLAAAPRTGEPQPEDSGTYGELPPAVRKAIDGHEWDNMTREEQRVWLIARAEEVETLARTAMELWRYGSLNTPDFHAAMEALTEPLRAPQYRRSALTSRTRDTHTGGKG